jgi:hypothetical protein
MLRTTAILTLMLTGADHWTTYLCLRSPVSGWQVMEANPVVDWLFGMAGLLGGLAIDSLFTLGVIAFLVQSRRFSQRTKQAFLSAIVLATGYAVVNNIQAISALGISPLGQG